MLLLMILAAAVAGTPAAPAVPEQCLGDVPRVDRACHVIDSGCSADDKATVRARMKPGGAPFDPPLYYRCARTIGDAYEKAHVIALPSPPTLECAPFVEAVEKARKPCVYQGR